MQGGNSAVPRGGSVPGAEDAATVQVYQAEIRAGLEIPVETQAALDCGWCQMESLAGLGLEQGSESWL